MGGALAVLRQVAGEVLVRAEAAALDALAPDADPVAEMRDRAGPERDVDLRVEVEDPLLLRLGEAAADRDHEVGVLALPRPGVAEVGGELRVGLLADRARVEDDESASSFEVASPRPSDSSIPLMRSESWLFI